MARFIMDWGSAFEHLTPESNAIHRRSCETYALAEKETDSIKRDSLIKEVDRLRRELLDLTDTRRICVVYNRSPGWPLVRTLLRVSEDAEEHLEELKKEYYQEYAECEGDTFHFETGLHRAQAFAESLK